MTPAKLWLSIFLTPFAVAVALMAGTLFTPVPYGDLARIGRISERDFGWTIEPPKVAPALVRGVPLAQADILVLGDSYSASHRWQSVLAADGYGVATTYWGQIDETLCDDFDGWLARSGFHGRLVIIESVERLLKLRLDRSRGCHAMKSQALDAPSEPPSPPAEHVPGFALNWDAQLMSGWLTRKCTRAAIAGEQRRACDPQTRAYAVADGCSLFSNRLCGMALFLTEDVRLGALAPEQLARMQGFAGSQATVPILWMVVPNKTTTYLDPTHSEAFAQALAQSGDGPDLFRFAQQQKTKIRDFYFPNDTHLSMHGQLALGARMLEAVHRRIGRSAPLQ